MKFKDGSLMSEEDLIAIYSRRISIGEKYELWQHSYIKDGVLEVNPDLQIVCFNTPKYITTFYISQNKYRLSDRNHIGKMQLVFHDICERFEENTVLVKNIHSPKTGALIDKLIKETLSKERRFEDTLIINNLNHGD